MKSVWDLYSSSSEDEEGGAARSFCDSNAKGNQASGRTKARNTTSPPAAHSIVAPTVSGSSQSLKRPRPTSPSEWKRSQPLCKGLVGPPTLLPPPPPPRRRPSLPSSPEVALPWLSDRFYINTIASEASAEKKNGRRDCETSGEGSTAYPGAEMRSDRLTPELGGEGVDGSSRFSIAKLVEVVSGERWPGIQAAIFGTFSLDIRRLAEDVPILFSSKNRKIPVLILHGDKSLTRQPLRQGRESQQQPQKGKQQVNGTVRLSTGGALDGDVETSSNYEIEGKLDGYPGMESDYQSSKRRRSCLERNVTVDDSPDNVPVQVTERGDFQGAYDAGALAPSADRGEQTCQQISDKADGRSHHHADIICSARRCCRAFEDASDGKPGRESGTRRGGGVFEDYVLNQKAIEGRAGSSNAGKSYLEAGRWDRFNGWDLLLPGNIQVEKVNVHTQGVHHPKFGLLFLNDGSLVVFVGTANLGTDTAIDATWVQHFKATVQDELRCACVEGSERALASAEASLAKQREWQTDRSDGPLGDEQRTWQGDFAETLQDFLVQESRLMEKNLDPTDRAAASRIRLNTPVRFMQRVPAIDHLGDSFDFSTAAVDLIPTMPRIDPPSKTQRTGHAKVSGASAAARGTLLRQRSSKLRSSRGGSFLQPTVPVASEAQWPRVPGPARALSVPTPTTVGRGQDGAGHDVCAEASGEHQSVETVDSWRLQGRRSSAVSLPLTTLATCNCSCMETDVRMGQFSCCDTEARPESGRDDPNCKKAMQEKHETEGARQIAVVSISQEIGGDATSDHDAVEEQKEVREARAPEARREVVDVLFRYGQLRVQYVLGKRRGEAGSLGPEDVLIVQPTSIGKGVNSHFMEILAQSFMPESVGNASQLWADYDEPRVESSVRIIWPSREFMETCRFDMIKSENIRDRQAATAMRVEHAYILGATNKPSSDEARCGFLFLTPEGFEQMGTDLHDCLHTFKIPPASGLPQRPTHVKSAMRLRRAPAGFTRPPAGVVANSRVPKTQWSFFDDGRGTLKEKEADTIGVVDGNGPCEHVQHLAWFILTSACLSKGAQGEITHANQSGRTVGITCKNVELGVLFHSSPERAFYMASPPGCGCRIDPKASQRRSAGGSAGPIAIPLPVPFRHDSEAYADRENGSPHPRFLPFMHFLQEYPRSAEMELLLVAETREAQLCAE